MSIIGKLSLRDYDAGAIRTLDGEILSYDVDGVTRQAWALSVSGVFGLEHLDGAIPVLFQNPEDVFQEYTVPCVVIKRSSLRPAFDRHPWVGVVAAKAAGDAVTVEVGDSTVQGTTKSKFQPRPDPYDISYDVEIKGRLQADTLRMLSYAQRRYRAPWFRYKVIDSKGDIRYYDAGEISISQTSELAGLADRVISWTISFVVRAELDLYEDYELTNLTSLPQFDFTLVEGS